MKKFLYYVLSFTWGLPLTLAGLIVGAALMIVGYRPSKWLYGYCFEVGERWGGLNLGIVFLCNKNSPISIKNHEFGHSLQNCVFGIFTIFIVCIPSVIRYWYREIKYNRKGLTPPTAYSDIWFEHQADAWGEKLYKELIK